MKGFDSRQYNSNNKSDQILIKSLMSFKYVFVPGCVHSNSFGSHGELYHVVYSVFWIKHLLDLLIKIEMSSNNDACKMQRHANSNVYV